MWFCICLYLLYFPRFHSTYFACKLVSAVTQRQRRNRGRKVYMVKIISWQWHEGKWNNPYQNISKHIQTYCLRYAIPPTPWTKIDPSGWLIQLARGKVPLRALKMWRSGSLVLSSGALLKGSRKQTKKTTIWISVSVKNAWEFHRKCIQIWKMKQGGT